MIIDLPQLSLVVLIGASGSGKSTFARRFFRATEVVSSDACRGIVSDDENNQAATADAFDLLHYIVGKRLQRGLLTVVDATNVHPEDRRRYVDLARSYHCLPVAIVLDLPERVCHERNILRTDRDFGPHVIRRQRTALRRGLRGLRREGFRHVWVLESLEQTDSVEVTRTPLWNDRRGERGPFDIIGDVHGCYNELLALLQELGYEIQPRPGAPRGTCQVTPPTTDGVPRRPVFLGDLVDRGPDSPAVLRLVMQLVAAGQALCVPGNHDVKLLRKLNGRTVQVRHGLAATLEQLEPEAPAFLEEVRSFLDGLVSHYVLDGGRLVVAHAGLREEMQGRGSGKVREFCLYGETTGETDEFGLPVRFNWAAEYRGRALVVYGHTPTPEAEWLNNTICIDTGCVFGGRLSALRYPERELVSVPAADEYAPSVRPFLQRDSDDARSAQQQHDDMLDLADVTGKRIIDTALLPNVTIRAENAAAALEVISRFAADPHWLIYLPPTMSPCRTSTAANLLEHPAEALDAYRSSGVDRVICEEKHMGSRAVVIVCRDADAARQRFAAPPGESGIVYTRTGRRFFDDASLEADLLERVRAAATRADLWARLETTWLCLDCELMPWSAKAQGLLRDQYAAVGSAAQAALAATVPTLEAIADRDGSEEVADVLRTQRARQAAVAAYTRAYRSYCWPVTGLDDLRLAPFHLLASEGRVHTDRDHLWHMGTLAELAADDDLLLATGHRVVDLTDADDCAGATAWWEEKTDAGGEGMVVKPLAFVARGPRGLLQPAVKCRGPEYLRIIYGPEYLLAGHLDRLRQRGLRHKQSLALREFALGLEGLQRFVRKDPLRRVHECVFGVLALESEPVDPRL